MGVVVASSEGAAEATGGGAVQCMSSRRLTQTHIHKGLSTGLATVLGTLSSKFSKCQGLAGTGKPENPSGPLRLTRRLKTTMTSSSRLYTSTDSPPTSGERSPITPDTLHSPTGPKAPSINPVVRRTSSVLGSSCQGRCHWSRRQGQGDRSTDTRSPVRAWNTAGIPAPSAPGSPGKCRPKEHSPYERQPQRHRAARAGAPRGLWLLGVILACSLFGVGTPLELRMPQWAGATLGPRKGGVRRPCSPIKTAKIIWVRSERDIWRRASYPEWQTVRLLFDRSLWLWKPLAFDHRHSCTLLQAFSKRGRIGLYYKGTDAPMVSITGAGNMLFVGISLQNSVRRGAPKCNLKYGAEGRATCPALYIIESHNIQYTKASVYGRIDIFRSVYIKLDSLRVTMAKDSYSSTIPPASFNNHGVIRVGECSAGGQFLGSGIVISNNEIYGSWELVTLYRGAVGVRIQNNYFHNYIFTAIRCGADVGYVMDCHQTWIGNNYIYAKPFRTLTGDSAGIYFCTHWFNPANVLYCNYIIGGDHCYYFDFASSGISVYGGVCAYTWDGFKINTGKFNRVRHVIMVGQTHSVSFVSCITSTFINCWHYPGSYYETIRKQVYDKPQINGPYPWMKTICNPVKYSINGKKCNWRGKGLLTGKDTGNCAGVPYGNDVSLVVVNYKKENFSPDFCPSLPSAWDLNVQSVQNVTWKEAAFRGRGDYGLHRRSKIFKGNSGFTSCPRRNIGPRFVRIKSYMNDWNIPEPGILSAVIANDFSTIFRLVPGT